MEIQKANILGVPVSCINKQIALDVIDDWIRAGKQSYVIVRDVHGIMECQRDDELHAIHNRAGLVTPDGMPVVWICRSHGYSYVDRVYGPDLMMAACEMSEKKGYRQFFYGAGEKVPDLLKEKLLAKCPDLKIVGGFSPPFRPLTPEEDEVIVQMINEANPDILWIGLSTPKQEKWMAAHMGKIKAPVMIGVGAAFDFHAGLVKQAPKWIQRSGMEWAFRLVQEPKRLWKRYLVNNPAFIFLFIQQVLGIRKFPLEADSTEKSADQ